MKLSVGAIAKISADRSYSFSRANGQAGVKSSADKEQPSPVLIALLPVGAI